jgi:DNA-binding IclR family transcriptional regulator
MHDAQIDHLSQPLVRAFAHLLANSPAAFTVAELVAASGGSKAGIYRTMGSLWAARVVKKGKRGRFCTFALLPTWADASLGMRLWDKAQALCLRVR